jgi:MFS superfamily sulfate permease-like transporter
MCIRDRFHAAFLLVVVLALSPIISEIATSALAGILIGTSYRMASPANLREMLRTTRLDSSILIITALVVIFLDLIWGILIGTALYYLLNKFKSYNLKRK